MARELGELVTRAVEPVPIAEVRNVTGQATILRSGERLPAEAGAKLFEKDVIQTSAAGGVGITFKDKTVFTAGASCEVALDAFKFDSNKSRDSTIETIQQGRPAAGASSGSSGAMKG